MGGEGGMTDDPMSTGFHFSDSNIVPQAIVSFERATGRLTISPSATRDELVHALQTLAAEYYREMIWPRLMEERLRKTGGPSKPTK